MKLNGWDTAYATTIDQVNAVLADPKNTVSTFSLTEQGLTVTGAFGAWSIVPGGSGQLLHLVTNILSGTVSGGGVAAGDLAGTSVLLEVNLQFLPTKLPQQQDLRFHFEKVGKAGAATGPGVVTPLSVTDPHKSLSFLQSAVLGVAVAQCLVDHADSISFAFANISLAPPGPGDGWLAPVSCAYTYFQTGNQVGYLVVLAVTDSRSTDALSRQIDPELVAGAGHAFFAISSRLFLEHVIQPVLPQVYPGTKAASFSFDAVRNRIECSSHIAVGGVKSGAITYYPIINALAITVAGSSVCSAAFGDCDLYMGMSMTFGVTCNALASFDGSKAELSLARDTHPNMSYESHIPWYDYLMGGIPDLIMAIVVPLVADGIADGLGAAVSNMSFTKAGPQSVKWAGTKAFTPAGGELNDSLRLWGSLA
ncbi:MAG: TULIP family P47-like protein [Planctomycetota bacterium]